MKSSLSDKKIVRISKSLNLVNEYQACALNSILTIIHNSGFGDKISVDEIKNIFDYDHEGISSEKHRFYKLNTYLNNCKVPYRFYIRKYGSLQELYKYLNIQGPVPVFFWMNVLQFTKDKYKNMEYQLNFGDVFQTDNKHVLLFVGYDKAGEKIFFIDPSYQLPWIGQKEDLQKYYFELSIKDFYECTKRLKILLEVKYSKVYEKKYKREKTKKKEKQLELK